ncbi:electron transfer flavoprotein subunit beta/FixA family protein [Nocardioides aquiterrae]|uniref:Electron transfer flavoprotein subunit beta/FixA family protein n=1 Tax=Nocardioides aquiterrae TaxID=203799 RepID=A0ABN1UDM0_9ACTN
MRIVVCVKPVPPEPTLDDAGRLDRSGGAALTGVDESAVETALRVRDGVGGEVVVLAMVPPDAADALRPALAMGADRAVVVAGDALAGADLLATSSALAAALRGLGPDLVVLGAASGDGNGALLWAALGERLGLPVLSRAVEVTVADGRVRATRQTESGLHRAEAELPAVLALSGEVCVPRYPSFRDVIAAKKAVLETVTPAELGVPESELGAAGSRTRVLAAAPAPARGEAEIIEDDGDAHERVVDFLAQRRLL